jgi:hypothetical protein
MIICACVMSLFLMTQSALMNFIFVDVCMRACSNSRMAGWIFVKFRMGVMPFEANNISCLLVSYIW